MEIPKNQHRRPALLISSGKLALKVTPRARSEGVEGLNTAAELVVKVRIAPEDGKANEAVIALIVAVTTTSTAQAFGIPKSRLEITRGAQSRHKIIAYHAPRA